MGVFEGVLLGGKVVVLGVGVSVEEGVGHTIDTTVAEPLAPTTVAAPPPT